MKAGDTIKIKNKALLKAIRDASKYRDAIVQMVTNLAYRERQITNDIWKTIHQVYPETDGFTLNIDEKTATILIMEKRDDD